MHVSYLEIENFRGIKTAKIQLRTHSVLIGPNNSGKTTIVEALALILGRDRLIRSLTEHDFFGSTPTPADRIKITATITGFGSEDFTEHPDWFGERRAVPFWFDPETAHVLPDKTHARQRLACQIAFAARFDAETLEVETARYFSDGGTTDVFEEERHIGVPATLIRNVGFFLIPASRSWDRMLSFSSELFRRVIRSADGLPAATILGERDTLRRPDPALENDARLKPVIDQVNLEMLRLLGSAAPLRLRVTATDSAAVLEAVTPHFDVSGGAPVPGKRQGSGLVSLQSLFLLLHFGQKRIADGESFLMALEEPELHLPPGVQRRVLARLQALSTQTIVSTHSPLVAAFCEATSLLIVRNTAGTLTVAPLLRKPLATEATNTVRKLFQINRVDTAAAMMAEFVLVPEGRLDFDWLTLLGRVADLDADGQAPCLFGVRVGVVPTSDAKVKETCDTLAAAHPAICALVDGDRDGTSYADALDAEGSGARKVLRWPAGWTIENVVGWIIKADEAQMMTRLAAEPSVAEADRVTLVTRLKTDTRVSGGLKGDRVAFESIADALSERPACRARVRGLLHGIAEACEGKATPHFVLEAGREGKIPRLLFTP